jgi:transposase InsO family protein
VAALVRIDPDDHHGTCLPPSWVARTGRSAYPNRGDATLLLSQIGRSSGVDEPQQRHKPQKAKQTTSEPADPLSVTLATATIGTVCSKPGWSSTTSNTSTTTATAIRPWATEHRPSTLRHAGIPTTRWPVRSTKSGTKTPDSKSRWTQYRGLATAMESFWARMQVELLNTRKWATTLELAAAMADYIDNFYNVERRHSYLGNISPTEFETLWTSTYSIPQLA